VTFDPFGDFATEGYLRNFEKEKDLAIVKRAENASFMTGLDEAFATLAKAKLIMGASNDSCSLLSKIFSA
jgi:cell filamentation protein